MKTTLIIITGLFFSSVFANNIARVKALRGEVKALGLDLSTRDLKKSDWLLEGETIITAKRSFVRLNFIDDSNVNIGPSSKVKVEQFKKDAPGVLSVVTGKIRAQVSKDYLKMQKNKSKLFVRSSNAVMGIRGTDFLFSTNSKTKNTVAVLFEGSVVFNRLDSKDTLNINKYESIVNRGQSIKPGQLSSVSGSQKVMKPKSLNKAQFLNLKNNKTISQNNRSAVPSGLSSKVVSSSDTSKAGINKRSELTNGAVINLKSGKVIDNASLRDGGEVTSSGEFLLPKDVSLNSKGELVQKSVDQKTNKVKQIPLPEGVNYRPSSFLNKEPRKSRGQKKFNKIKINIKPPSENITDGTYPNG